MIRLVKRAQPSAAWSYGAPLLAVLATIIFGGILFALLGKNPVEAIRTIFFEPLFGEFAFFYRPQLLIKGAPLVLIAIGLALGFRAGIWNIGAEGQYIVGAICGAGAGLAFYPAESVFIFPIMVLAGALGGCLWALIPRILKVKFGTNEILVSLMLVYVAEQLLASMSLGLLKTPEGFGFPGSRNLQQYPAAHNAELIADTGMHWGVVAALIAVIFAYVLLTRHRLGFAIRVTGVAPRAAKFGGAATAGDFAALHLTAQFLHHHLLAVADAKDRHAQIEHRDGRAGAAITDNAVRAAGKNHGFGGKLGQKGI